jgi:hypothetical protein
MESDSYMSSNDDEEEKVPIDFTNLIALKVFYNDK